MIGKKAVTEAVKAELSTKWPDRDVHRNRCPAEFTRPCFLLENPRTSRRDVNAGQIEETVYLTVTCFGALNDYGDGDSDVEELERMQSDVIDLFRAGFLYVGDRAVKFAASEGGIDFDRAWIDLQCSYYERRAEQPALPLMMEIHNEFKEG